MMNSSCPIVATMTTSDEKKAACTSKFAAPGIEKSNSHPVGPTRAKPCTPGQSRRSPSLRGRAMAAQRIKDRARRG